MTFSKCWGKNYQTRILCSVKITFKNEGKLKIFFTQTKAEEVVCRRYTLLMEVPQVEKG